jgi:hypothetical protein
VSAALEALPGTRLIAVPRLSPARRAIRLARLAADVTEDPGRLPASDVAVLLAAYASGSLHGDALARAWQEYLSAVAVAADADSGLVTPAEICPEVISGDRAETAREITRMAAAEALRVLVHGERGDDAA